MKKVLWISRHPLVEEARKEIEAKFGEVEIEAKDVLFDANGEEAFKQLEEASRDYDIVGGVLPAQLWAYMMKKGIKFEKPFFVLVSVPVTAEDGKTRKFEFHHLEWTL